MKTLFTIMMFCLVAGGAIECDDGDGGDVDSDSDSDGDGDLDGDTDADSDADGDTDEQPGDCEWTCVYGGGGCTDGDVHCEGQVCPNVAGVGICCGPPWEC